MQNLFPTPQAEWLATSLKRLGWDPKVEYFDGYKHIDIAILESRVYIEVDGIQHCDDSRQALADLERSFYSFREGFVTLRIPNVLVRDAEAAKKTAEFVDKFLREGGEAKR